MITAFYDGACSLCTRKMKYYERIESDALQYLHALDETGKIHVGLFSFILIWEQLSKWHNLARIYRLPRIFPLMSFIYLAFAKWRFKRQGYYRRN